MRVFMDEIFTLVANVGFPIVITIYLITKFEKTIECNTRAIQGLTDFIRSKANK